MIKKDINDENNIKEINNNNLNTMTIIYNINNDDTLIKLFGGYFC